MGCVVEIPSGRVFLAERGRGLVEGGPVNLSPQHLAGAHVLGLRLPRPADAHLRRAARRPGGRILGWRRHLRAGLGLLRHDAHPHGPARCVHRARPARDRRTARDARGIRARGRRGGAQQHPLRPRRRGALPDRGRGGGDRRDGPTLADRPLLGSGAEHQMSIVASANRRLHEQILGELDGAMERLAFRFHAVQETETT